MLVARSRDRIIVDKNEHLRPTTSEALAKLKPLFNAGSVTAGNASSVNYGAAAFIFASASASRKYGLKPISCLLDSATAGLAPRVMAIRYAPASEKLLAKHGLDQSTFDVSGFKEAFASKRLASFRMLGIKGSGTRVNRNSGAKALGYALSMTRDRFTGPAAHDLNANGGRRSLSAMRVASGKGIAIAMERVSKCVRGLDSYPLASLDCALGEPTLRP